MPEGIITQVPKTRGMGCLKSSSDKILYFYCTAVKDIAFHDLREGQRVSYTEMPNPNGKFVENVRPVT